jgi:2-phospho-L-lactate/phosphoenolpyruvate guanylyltransferase
MSKLRTGAIIPVKTFSKAKTRLNLSYEKTEILCRMMLEEVLQTVSQSDVIEKIAVVSKDESAFKIGKKFGVVEIYDEKEQSVNNAVAMAHKYFLDEGFDATIVFPQDIPLMQTEDIQMLCDFQMPKKCVLVVPSRRFDGTNALFRSPVDVMETHYDEDSYKIHLTTANNRSAKYALVLIRRIMLDVDEPEDLQTILKYSKPSISKMIEGLLI